MPNKILDLVNEFTLFNSIESQLLNLSVKSDVALEYLFCYVILLNFYHVLFYYFKFL